MFRVEVDSLSDYFAFDPAREADLRGLDRLIRRAAPGLKRYFHKGTPAGAPGMRFKMIGYGRSFYRASNGDKVEWPVVGVALQKNYISVYIAALRAGEALTEPYRGRLGEKRMGPSNFSFVTFENLHAANAAALFGEAAEVFAANPETVDEAMRG